MKMHMTDSEEKLVAERPAAESSFPRFVHFVRRHPNWIGIAASVAAAGRSQTSGSVGALGRSSRISPSMGRNPQSR